MTMHVLLSNNTYTGRIGCANVLSDLYALGVSFCDSMLMTLAASTDMKHSHRTIVTRQMIKGFSDLAKEAGCG